MAGSFNLEEFLPYRLSVAANTVSQKIAKAYKDYDLSPTAWRILAVLASGNIMTARQISEKTAMDKTTISRAIKSMQKRGLLTAKPAQDGRTLPICLSAKGNELFLQIIKKVMAQDELIKSRLSQSQISDLMQILDILAQK